MARLESSVRRRLVRHEIDDAHIFGVHIGERRKYHSSESRPRRARTEYDMHALIWSARIRSRGFRVRKIGGNNFRAHALRKKRRPADLQHSK
jgi:hypothetical protein